MTAVLLSLHGTAKADPRTPAIFDRGCGKSSGLDRLTTSSTGVGMGRFVEGQDRRQCWLMPSSLDDYVTADNPVRVNEPLADASPNCIGFVAGSDH